MFDNLSGKNFSSNQSSFSYDLKDKKQSNPFNSDIAYSEEKKNAFTSSKQK